MILIIIIIILIVLTFNIKIEINDFEFEIAKNYPYLISENSKILLKIYVLFFLKIAQIDLLNVLRKKKIKEKIKKRISSKKFKYVGNGLKNIDKLKYALKKIDLQIGVGIGDPGFTAILVGYISIFLSLFLSKILNDFNNKKYEINPLYNRNILKIKLNGIIAFNVLYIVNVTKM